MRTSDGPPMVAVITASLFRVRNWVFGLLGFFVGMAASGFLLGIAGGMAGFALGVGQGFGDREFLALVQSRRTGVAPGLSMQDDIEALPPGPVKEAFQKLLPRLEQATPDQLAQFKKSLAQAKKSLALPSEPATPLLPAGKPADSIGGELEYLKEVVNALGPEGDRK